MGYKAIRIKSASSPARQRWRSVVRLIHILFLTARKNDGRNQIITIGKAKIISGLVPAPQANAMAVK